MEPVDPDQLGANRLNPIPRDIRLEPEEEISPGQMTMNMCTWLVNVFFAAFWFWIPAFFGDFEAYFFYIRDQNELLPPAIRYHTEEYFNRFDGVIISFRNTSYTPPKTNWTEPPDIDPDAEEDPLDGGGIIDLNTGMIKVKNTTTEKKVRSAGRIYEEQNLHFMPSDEDRHYKKAYDDDKYEAKTENQGLFSLGWLKYLGRSKTKGWFYGKFLS